MTDRKFSKAPGFPQFLREAIGERNIADVAAGSGVSPTSIRTYLRGEGEPTRPALVALAGYLGVSVGSLAAGQADEAASCTPIPYLPLSCFSSSQIEFHRGRKLEARRILFDREWIEKTSGAKFNDLFCLFMEGDSMGSTLRSGNYLLIARFSGEGIPHDGIYALRLPSGVVVRRLQSIPNGQGGKVRIIADNNAYVSMDIPLEVLGQDCEDATDKVVMIGRVVWVGHRL